MLYLAKKSEINARVLTMILKYMCKIVVCTEYQRVVKYSRVADNRHFLCEYF